MCDPATINSAPYLFPQTAGGVAPAAAATRAAMAAAQPSKLSDDPAENERLLAANKGTDAANMQLRLERLRKRYQKSLLGSVMQGAIVRPPPGSDGGAAPGGGGGNVPGTKPRPEDPVGGTKRAAGIGGGRSVLGPITIGPG